MQSMMSNAATAIIDRTAIMIPLCLLLFDDFVMSPVERILASTT
jgi:uncharacterized membrane protein